VVAIVAVASVAVWRKVRPHVESQPEYLVATSDVEITPPPEWIHSNVKSEAIRNAGMPEKLSILDDHLAERLTQAFSLHPWIAAVQSVHTSYPAHIKVQLSYRKPVAMVAVYGGLLPVDVEGILLPTEDFSPEAAQHYPRIAGIATSPLGPIGTRWGDATLEAMARLADMLGQQWQTLQLHHLETTGPKTPGTAHLQLLELVTRGGVALVWGAPPGSEPTDEQNATEKLDHLRQLATRFGTLDKTPEEFRDLRGNSKIP
jgi:hypothetical protein